MSKDTEYCGRCAMSSVVEMTDEGDGAGDPFAGDRIEVDEDALRAASPAAWLSGVTSWLDDLGTRFVHGR